jgi:hypothetical protein
MNKAVSLAKRILLFGSIGIVVLIIAFYVTDYLYYLDRASILNKAIQVYGH